MTALVVAQSVVVALLGLLVVALLRSHAEILRRLHEIDPVGGGEHDPHHEHGPTPVEFGVRPGVALPRESETPAYDVVGVTAAGEDVALALVGAGTSTLLAFLSSGCLTCLDFWHAFAREDSRLPDGMRLVVLTKGPEQESASRVAELTPPGVQVVMSTQAWVDYQVPMAPYFLLVDGPAGVVRGEGAASSWRQLTDLMGQALADSGSSAGRRRAKRRPVGPAERESRIDAELLAAGIGPGDPSLHPDPEAFGTVPEPRR
jgi:hypothetical protein